MHPDPFFGDLIKYKYKGNDKQENQPLPPGHLPLFSRHRPVAVDYVELASGLILTYA